MQVITKTSILKPARRLARRAYVKRSRLLYEEASKLCVLYTTSKDNSVPYEVLDIIRDGRSI